MTKHRITVLGAGDMGGAILQALTERTRHIVADRGSRLGCASATALVDRLGVREASEADIEHSDIVFAVVPAKAIPAIEPLLQEHRGIVISVSVSGAAGRDGQKSVAEQLADAAPGTRAVSAFTSIWSDVIREPGNAGKTSAFVCSDDDDAKAIVMRRRIRFRADKRRKTQRRALRRSVGRFRGPARAGFRIRTDHQFPRFQSERVIMYVKIVRRGRGRIVTYA